MVATTSQMPWGWERVKDVHELNPIEFDLLLQQRNLDWLSETFDAVSDPQSPRWGRFPTLAEINAMLRPDDAVFERIRQWTAPFGESVTLVEFADSITVRTTVGVAAKLLHVPFAVFRHRVYAEELIRADGDVTLPEEIAVDVQLLAGITEFMTPRTHKLTYSPVSHRDDDTKKPNSNDPIVTPPLLRQYYNVPTDLQGTNPNTFMGIAAFQDYFSMGALRAFEKNQSLPQANVTRYGPDCLAQGCDQYESDLDVQYITSMARNISLTFLNQGGGYWILKFVEQVAQGVTPAPLVWSLSYGWSELAQCEIATIVCGQFGYNSMQYVNRTNTSLQKLGAAGVTVLVSSGDDGAPSLGGATGNCPMDIKTYCPLGGCQHTTTLCGEFSVVTVSNSSGRPCIFPMGIGADSCQDFLNDDNANAALTAFIRANTNCALNIEQDVEQNPHVYSSCDCSSLMSTTSHGYKFVQYVYTSSIPMFAPDYPTSSPFVLSVGATMFIDQGNGKLVEDVCTIENGAIITSGGGFSSFQPAASWQKAAIQQYLAAPGLPPSDTFNPAMRSYPDIVFNGHHYEIFYSPAKGDTCGRGCKATLVDGTSCSSPALAGLLSLVNDALLNNDLPQLGFINPLLYQAATDNNCADCFYDVATSGATTNRCNRAYCCSYGFPTANGFDAVTGIGSVNFSPLLQYIVSQRRAHKEKYGY